MNRRKIANAACGAVLLTTIGCGSDSDSSGATTTSVDPATVTTLPTTTAAAVTPTLGTVASDTTTAPSVAPTVSAAPGSTASTTATTTAGRVVSSPSDNVRVGDTGPGVQQIQTALKTAGYDLDADGIFGAVTDNAVRDYQRKNGLGVDGIVGPKTWAKLGQGGGSSASTTTTPTTTTSTTTA